MPIITLLSDFGSISPYPASMKAILAAGCDATLIDISHDVPRHDIWVGAYLLAAVAPHLPAGTVHLAVVDPGVGTARAPLIISSGGQFFVGPDNGLLVPAAKRVGRPRVFTITDPTLVSQSPSATFHGRDLFAPVAVKLARGTPVASLAASYERYVDLDFGTGTRSPTGLQGLVLYIDPFGNLITNIPSSSMEGITGWVRIRVGPKSASGQIARAYGDVEKGALIVIAGSDGVLEVAVREGNAAALLDAKAGATVQIEG
jgi:S-adenosylmethionine hydrolase